MACFILGHKYVIEMEVISKRDFMKISANEQFETDIRDAYNTLMGV